MTVVTTYRLRLVSRTTAVAALALAACGGARAEEQLPEPTTEQRVACTPDAFRLCFNEIPDIARVRACMRANKANLSARCRATFRS